VPWFSGTLHPPLAASRPGLSQTAYAQNTLSVSGETSSNASYAESSSLAALQIGRELVGMSMISIPDLDESGLWNQHSDHRLSRKPRSHPQRRFLMRLSPGDIHLLLSFYEKRTAVMNCTVRQGMTAQRVLTFVLEPTYELSFPWLLQTLISF
jgi:hypothetical protein